MNVKDWGNVDLDCEFKGQRINLPYLVAMNVKDWGNIDLDCRVPGSTVAEYVNLPYLMAMNVQDWGNVDLDCQVPGCRTTRGVGTGTSLRYNPAESQLPYSSKQSIKKQHVELSANVIREKLGFFYFCFQKVTLSNSLVYSRLYLTKYGFTYSISVRIYWPTFATHFFVLPY